MNQPITVSAPVLILAIGGVITLVTSLFTFACYQKEVSKKFAVIGTFITLALTAVVGLVQENRATRQANELEATTQKAAMLAFMIDTSPPEWLEVFYLLRDSKIEIIAKQAGFDKYLEEIDCEAKISIHHIDYLVKATEADCMQLSTHFCREWQDRIATRASEWLDVHWMDKYKPDTIIWEPVDLPDGVAVLYDSKGIGK